MREEKEQPKTPGKLQNLSTEEKRNFVGFFELLLKVDKRANPHLYQLKNKE